MKSIIFLLALISYALCAPHRGISDIYKEFKTRIYQCILKSDVASAQLKEIATKNLKSNETSLLSLNSIEITNEDRLIARDCKKQAFRKKSSFVSQVVTPFGINHAVHSKKSVEKKPREMRKLSMIGQIKRLGSFNIMGIFTCIENAQPAIKIIRDNINLIRSMDYTTAVVNIYDNIGEIAQALTFCFNTIFPSD